MGVEGDWADVDCGKSLREGDALGEGEGQDAAVCESDCQIGLSAEAEAIARETAKTTARS